MSLYSGYAFHSNAALSDFEKSGNKSYSAVVSSNLFCHTTQLKSSVTVFNHFPSPPLKNSFTELSAYTKVSEELFLHTFLQYSFYAQHLLIRLRQTDIIFPFHYFW
jgi:hypothetical protein